MLPTISIARLEAQFQAVVERLRSANTFILTTHLNPDADAIGSSCALALALRSMGKSVRMVNTSPTPESFSFLPGAETIELYDSAIHNALVAEAECIICLDFNVPKRCGPELGAAIELRREAVIMIDHHIDPAAFYALALHDIEATSTAEIIFKLLATAFASTLNAEIATNIYAGIMADSGNFRFPRVCAETHYIVAALIEYGANPVTIYDTMYNSWSIDRTRLIAEAVSSMTLHCGGRLCMMKVTKEMYHRHHCTEDAVESAVQQTLSIKGVKCGVLLAERESKDEIKISLRSKAEFGVQSIATHFGGGGHFYASGARKAQSSLDEVEREVLALAEKEFEKLDGATQA